MRKILSLTIVALFFSQSAWTATKQVVGGEAMVLLSALVENGLGDCGAGGVCESDVQFLQCSLKGLSLGTHRYKCTYIEEREQMSLRGKPAKVLLRTLTGLGLSNCESGPCQSETLNVSCRFTPSTQPQYLCDIEISPRVQ